MDRPNVILAPKNIILEVNARFEKEVEWHMKYGR